MDTIFLITDKMHTQRHLFSCVDSPIQILNVLDFPGGTVVKNLPANAGDTGSIPGLGRSHIPWSN